MPFRNLCLLLGTQVHKHKVGGYVQGGRYHTLYFGVHKHKVGGYVQGGGQHTLYDGVMRPPCPCLNSNSSTE